MKNISRIPATSFAPLLACTLLTGCVAAALPLAALVAPDIVGSIKTDAKLSFDDKIKDPAFADVVRSTDNFILFPAQTSGNALGGMDSFNFDRLELSVADQLEANGVAAAIESKYGAPNAMSASQRLRTYGSACADQKNTAIIGFRSFEMKNISGIAEVYGLSDVHTNLVIDIYHCARKQLVSTKLDVSFAYSKLGKVNGEVGKGIADMIVARRKA